MLAKAVFGLDAMALLKRLGGPVVGLLGVRPGITAFGLRCRTGAITLQPFGQQMEFGEG